MHTRATVTSNDIRCSPLDYSDSTIPIGNEIMKTAMWELHPSDKNYLPKGLENRYNKNCDLGSYLPFTVPQVKYIAYFFYSIAQIFCTVMQLYTPKDLLKVLTTYRAIEVYKFGSFIRQYI